MKVSLTMVTDHGTFITEMMEVRMAETVTISHFKATCLALLAKVKRTGRPILVTRKGEVIAQILPPPPPEKPQSWLGSFHETGKILGDVVLPAADVTEWEVQRG